MSFLHHLHLLTNTIDVLRVGSLRANFPLIRAEFLVNHRVRDRIPLANLLPTGGIGAELGVFTGLFSTVLLDMARPRKTYFVDPWWKAYGEHYSDWGRYTDHGRLSTATAYEVAVDRITRRSRKAEIEIVVDYSTQFLARLPDKHLNWAYLDSTHSYEGTCEEFAILRRKIMLGGILAGDDWHDDQSHRHAGVARAIKEAIAKKQCELIGTFPSHQWAVRLP
jgi:hypothetical protein